MSQRNRWQVTFLIFTSVLKKSNKATLVPFRRVCSWYEFNSTTWDVKKKKSHFFPFAKSYLICSKIFILPSLREMQSPLLEYLSHPWVTSWVGTSYTIQTFWGILWSFLHIDHCSYSYWKLHKQSPHFFYFYLYHLEQRLWYNKCSVQNYPSPPGVSCESCSSIAAVGSPVLALAGVPNQPPEGAAS